MEKSRGEAVKESLGVEDKTWGCEETMVVISLGAGAREGVKRMGDSCGVSMSDGFAGGSGATVFAIIVRESVSVSEREVMSVENDIVITGEMVFMEERELLREAGQGVIDT